MVNICVSEGVSIRRLVHHEKCLLLENDSPYPWYPRRIWKMAVSPAADTVFTQIFNKDAEH